MVLVLKVNNFSIALGPNDPKKVKKLQKIKPWYPWPLIWPLRPSWPFLAFLYLFGAFQCLISQLGSFVVDIYTLGLFERKYPKLAIVR